MGYTRRGNETRPPEGGEERGGGEVFYFSNVRGNVERGQVSSINARGWSIAKNNREPRVCLGKEESFQLLCERRERERKREEACRRSPIFISRSNSSLKRCFRGNSVSY